MELQDGILTISLFLGYLILWYIKRREMLKSDGIDVNVISGATRPIQKYFGRLEKVMTALVVIIMAAHFFYKNKFGIVGYADDLDVFAIKLVGFFIGFLGLVICRVAQVTIGKSWRVGIDENAKPGLVTTCIYKYVRNPTYAGLFLLCAGVWIINPTYLYSYWILAFLLMMEFQVRCEEEYLENQYGNKFLEYSARTKRYIPMIC